MASVEETRKQLRIEIERLSQIFMNGSFDDILPVAFEAGGPIRTQLVPSLVNNVVAAQAAMAIHLGTLGMMLGVDTKTPEQIDVKAMDFLKKFEEESADEMD